MTEMLEKSSSDDRDVPLEKSSSDDRDVPFTVSNDLNNKVCFFFFQFSGVSRN